MAHPKQLQRRIINDYSSDVVLGDIEGVSHVRKYGHNPAIANGATKTIWIVNSIYTTPSNSGESIQLASDDAADTGLSFKVAGLDQDFNAQEETITTNASDGTTPVFSVNTWSRVFRAFNDNGTELVGDITIASSGGVVTYAAVRANEEQTQQCHYTVPNSKQGVLVEVTVSLNKSAGGTGGLDVFLKTRKLDKVYRERWQTGLLTTGSTYVAHKFARGLLLDPKEDVKLDALSGFNGADVTGEFHIDLVDFD